MQISYQERIGEDGEPLAVPILPAGASLPRIEVLVTESQVLYAAQAFVMNWFIIPGR